ncbi:MAG: hypothetical protein MUC60_18270, partial [Oscillatoria sp. Prado101]|nr:hypothetical protein [Oscillatoria sp. Prado101]
HRHTGTPTGTPSTSRSRMAQTCQLSWAALVSQRGPRQLPSPDGKRYAQPSPMCKIALDTL